MSGKPSPAARAAAHYFEALERVTTLDDAWHLVLSAPRGARQRVTALAVLVIAFAAGAAVSGSLATCGSVRTCSPWEIAMC